MLNLSYPYAYLYHTYNGVFVLDVSIRSTPRNWRRSVFRCIRRQGIPEAEHDLKKTAAPADSAVRPGEEAKQPGLRPGRATDGYLYFTGLFSDLHVFHDETLIKAETGKTSRAGTRLTVEGDFHSPDLATIQKAVSPLVTSIQHYRPGGQVYAAVEQNGLVYAACGSAGIHVLDKNLKLKTSYPTRGFAMDLQTAGNRLYVAESAGGLGCYHIDGAKLTPAGTYTAKWPIKQVRVSPNGRFAVVHAGGSVYEIIDVSDENNLHVARTERGWGGLVYYRQLCNGFVDGKYICGTWCAGRTFMLDLGGSEPNPLPDILGIWPDMEAGGYCPCGPYALVTRDGGYSFFKPGYEGKYEDLPVYRIKDGTAVRGKPTCRGSLLILCNRVDGDVALVDAATLTEPKLIGQFNLSGNVDCAFVGEDSVLISAGYQGLFRLATTRSGLDGNK